MRISNNLRILSLFLSLLMILGTLSILTILPAFADEAAGDEAPESEDATTEPETPGDTPTKEYITVEEAILTYLTKVYTSKEEKLATMTPKLSNGDLQMYIDARTGEVAVKNNKTGQILLSNPYDVATVSKDEEIKYSTVKNDLLSQVFISFKDMINGNVNRDMNSFADAAQYGQIKVKNIKNGLRVEYTLGKVATKKLMPLWIEASRFENMILSKIVDNEYVLKKIQTPYAYVNINGDITDSEKELYKQSYPCVGKTYKKVGYTPLIDTITFMDKLGKEVTHTYSVDDFMSIYAIDSKAVLSERESNEIEGYTKTYAPEYNYEEQEFDIQLTGYVAPNSQVAIFNMALEYTLTAKGLTVRLPANGISFDEESYQLNKISILNHMGATSGDYTGYTFIPDGSGTIIRNEDMMDYGLAYTISGEVYGPDFSYHTISYNGKSEIMRLPVFGAIEDTVYYDYDAEPIGKELTYQLNEDGTVKTDTAGNKLPAYELHDATAEPVTKITTTDAEGNTVTKYYVTSTLKSNEVTEEPAPSAETPDGSTEETPETPETPAAPKYEVLETSEEVERVLENGVEVYYKLKNGQRIKIYKMIYPSSTVTQGFVAIIKAGESLASITSSHGSGQTHKYNSVYATFTPLSTDTYNLRDAISVGDDATWSVTSERKYTGSFEISYTMLSDYEGSEYKGSYEGMAKVYQDYLIETQGLSLMSDVAADIPLYMESFGMLSIQDTFMTFPVWVETPLTSMEDIQAIRDELAKSNITNLHFRLTGFNEGGMDTSYAPTLVKFEKVLGGNKGYTSLVEDAKKDGYYVYPDFDFANVQGDKMVGDNFSYSKQTIRTIDDRYTSKREYDATYQSFQRIRSVAVSPWAYEGMVETFIDQYGDLPVSGISVSTLGTDLNSDFDQDEPYNREDNKEFTVAALKTLQEKYGNLMIDGGNAYALGYASHILNMPLDGSRYMRASQAVPFMGMVLHGYVQYAGSPTNMEGDIKYEILKIIENGASPFFMLSYQNTNELKSQMDLSKYYSVDFQIWKEDLIETYQTINGALKDVQNKPITQHTFIDGIRALSDAEKTEIATSEANAWTAYVKKLTTDLVADIKKAVDGKLVTVEEGHKYLNPYKMEEITTVEDVKSKVVNVPEGYDWETFISEYQTFEEYYTPGLDPVVDNHTIVYEVFGDTVGFVLNYNNFDVVVEINGESVTVAALDFYKFNVTAQN